MEKKIHQQRSEVNLTAKNHSFSCAAADMLCCQTYCLGFCGAAADARVLAASLAFSDASFTVSLSSRCGVSPERPESIQKKS